jgi:hypothetical protein
MADIDKFVFFWVLFGVGLRVQEVHIVIVIVVTEGFLGLPVL